MKRTFSAAVSIVILVLSVTSCVTLSQTNQAQYESLSFALDYSCDKMRGTFEGSFPNDLGDKFYDYIKPEISQTHYDTITKYTINVEPKSYYYFLQAYDPESKTLLVFQFCCDNKKGLEKVYENPEKYDLNNMQQYNTCTNN